METEKYKPRTPDIAEAVFDVSYLTFDLIAGIIFLACSGGQSIFILYGLLTLTLCFGDAFHLIPRVIRVAKGSSQKVEYYICLGLQVSSITMTIFYIILLYIWKAAFPELTAPMPVVLIIYISAVMRIAICCDPRNKWFSQEGNMKMSLIRNVIFCFTGIGVMILFAMSGNTYDYHLNRMVMAIAISFACYLPVVFFAKKKPMLGMLMIPKTLAYVWMIAMGLRILF